MAHRPTDWLAPVFESELQAVIAWYRTTKAVTKIKNDPESRFADDGSNFRSEVEPRHLSDSCAVQILKILSSEDALLLVSDGSTSVRARLSDDARQSLETEIGDAIDLDTKGDVFIIRKCTMVSTPYGPAEGHVQLLVEDIQYLYHLRKLLGAPIPVGEKPKISRLMSEMMRLRQLEPDEQSRGLDAPVRSHGTPKQNGRSDRFETKVSAEALRSPASQASILFASSPPAAASQAPTSQRAIATQLPVKRRKPAPELTKDGLELAVGVNLDRPTAAVPSRLAPNRPFPAPTKPPSVSEKHAALLSVLGKRKGPQQAPTAVKADWTSTNGMSEATSPSEVSSGKEQAEATSTLPQVSPKIVRERSTAAPVNQAEVPSQRSSQPGPRTFWRRKIPENQKRLLDSPSSWLPPLPGRQFSHPNVPIELLNQWKAQVECKPQSVTPSQPRPSSQRANVLNQSQSVARSDSSVSSEGQEDSGSDEELLPWSSSPPGPVRTRPQASRQDRQQEVQLLTSSRNSIRSSPEYQSSQPLPTSPVELSSRPSTATKRPGLPPDSSFEQASVPRALPREEAAQHNSMPANRMGETRPSDSDTRDRPFAVSQPSPNIQNTPARPRALPTRPSRQERPRDFSASSRTWYAPSTDMSGRDTSRQGDFYRPQYAEKPSASARNSSQQRFGGSSTSTPQRPPSNERRFHHVSQSPAQSRTPPAVPPSTAATVIKATQLSKSGEREASQSGSRRPEPRDPRLDHHKYRSEFFRDVQRREWIRQNYTPTRDKPFSLSALQSAYKKAHPKDQPRLSELAQAFEEAFPDLTEDDKGGKADTSSERAAVSSAFEANDNVSPTLTRPRFSLADMDAADATPSKVRNKPAVTEQQPERDSAVAQEAVDGTSPPRGMSLASASSRKTAAAPTVDIGKQAHSNEKKMRPLSGGADEQQGRQPTEPILEKHPPRPSVPSTTSTAPPRTAASTASASATKHASPLPSSSKPPPDHHIWFLKRLASDQRRLKNERATGRNTADGSSLAAFAGAWRKIGPGGAFALAQEQTARRRGGLSVLDWEL